MYSAARGASKGRPGLVPATSWARLGGVLAPKLTHGRHSKALKKNCRQSDAPWSGFWDALKRNLAPFSMPKWEQVGMEMGS